MQQSNIRNNMVSYSLNNKSMIYKLYSKNDIKNFPIIKKSDIISENIMKLLCPNGTMFLR